MAKNVWTGGYEGVCEINKKHQFHCDSLEKISRSCCGRKVKYEKIMHEVQIDDEKPTDKI